MLYQLRNFDQSLLDFEQLLEGNDKYPKAHYYKGKILKKKEHENEAILHFEQVIKYTTPISSSNEEIKQGSAGTAAPRGVDEELAGNALFEIAKIRINQKDFYEAFHNL